MSISARTDILSKDIHPLFPAQLAAIVEEDR
jgi:hypothetical protein